MISLLIDTSDDTLAVGIYKDKHALSTYEQDAARKTSELLIPVIQDLLKQADLSLSNIEKIVIAQGPGSYTGIRIGITFVKTLAVVYPDIEVYTLNSLQSIIGMESGIAIADAKSKRAYLATANEGVLSDVSLVSLADIDKDKSPIFRDATLVKEAKMPHTKLENMMASHSRWERVMSVDALSPIYIS